ncbi:glycosyltransferase family 4 protein [Mesorhizobium sp. LMG 17147]|uniref:glycosyltransferase family 4 protein n=1 Tax=Mesorhizobium sp. LMG 17147 TaxID=2963091 RepID=UPI0020C97DA4|nr:glycosyltransferase family 4 protein [Mesorhizobium sp. LMG 17147]MCP9234073.1 glycosyltransferase family 4 protein [Mesorhizobium sp. LMG 17147]
MVKKVLYFHHATSLGGAPRSLSLLVKGLDRERFQPIVVMPRRVDNDAVKALFSEAGAEVLEERDIRPFHGSSVAPNHKFSGRTYAIASYPLTARCAKRVVKAVRPDLVHLNSTCMVAAAAGAHMASPKLPVIAHVREPLLSNRWGRVLAGLNRKHVNAFISIDEAGLKTLGGNNIDGTVVYNFVDEATFHTDISLGGKYKRDQAWDADEVVFLFLARVAPSNGVLELVRLVESITQKLHPAARFVIAGFPKIKTGYALEAYEATRQSTRCAALDFVETPVPLMLASDVIIAPFTEPHSARSVFEGAALGKPSLVANIPHLAELVIDGHTGKVFSWHNSDSFVSAVNELCDGDKRVQMGRNSVGFAVDNFSSGAGVERTMSVYDRMLKK